MHEQVDKCCRDDHSASKVSQDLARSKKSALSCKTTARWTHKEDISKRLGSVGLVSEDDRDEYTKTRSDEEDEEGTNMQTKVVVA